MSHRLLGSQADFGVLNGKLSRGEILIAHWLRDPINYPEVEAVEDERHFDSIVAKYAYGYYNELKFIATSNFTENPFGYDSLQNDEETQSTADAIENLVTKAHEANVIDEYTARMMRTRATFAEAVSTFSDYVSRKKEGDPEGLLRSWGIPIN
ncbi:hypothetical protein [Streptomyces cucumeris]|uniref:hypothetical protein n=1 Tax=Streptomyces cucumeris TaxID=2962890 RepID=UPI003D71FF60